MKHRREEGYTLTELMVAVLVLLVGALAVFKMLAATVFAARFDRTLAEAARLAENRIVWFKGLDDVPGRFPAVRDASAELVNEEKRVDATVYRIAAAGGPAEGALVPLAVSVRWKDPVLGRDRDYRIEYVWRRP